VRAHGGPLALAAHYNVIRVLVARAIGIAPAHSFRLRVDLGAVTVLADDPGGWRLLRANVRGPRRPSA
jgi:broad specificity phosphatase PhoE